jgi:hypothetical protein
LDHPNVLPAQEARYLKDSDMVFGVVIQGKARAYPKRIIAWHEMVLDRVGEKEITLVYCTLCGTVIPYHSNINDLHYAFGTSGLLYRSNKLMFDHETYSLWSALTGEPVVGPLVGKGLRLKMFPVVTTTWGQWKKNHPGTTVISKKTGFTRDYREGAAYKDYFNTDRLMFPVALRDKRLKNKAEVLTIRVPGRDDKIKPVAIYTKMLIKKPVFHISIDRAHFVIITNRAGANRVYKSGNHRFTTITKDQLLKDSQGGVWMVNESGLQKISDPHLELPRYPAHRSFWFGWYAQYPDTLLFK